MITQAEPDNPRMTDALLYALGRIEEKFGFASFKLTIDIAALEQELILAFQAGQKATVK